MENSGNGQNNTVGVLKSLHYEKLSIFSLLLVAMYTSVQIKTFGAAAAATVTSSNCTADADCKSSDKNAVCNITGTHKCTCTGAFKVGGSGCAVKVLSDPCSNTTDCVNVTNAVCSASKCVCADSFKKTGSTCANKALNDACGKDDDCTHVTDATCDSSSKKCNCTGAYKVNGAVCANKGLGDSCSSNTDCNGVKQAYCGERNHECACSNGFKKQGGACVAKVVGSPCSTVNATNACSTSTLKTKCTSGHCACLNSSYTEENDECKKVVGGTCTANTDCPSNAICDKTTSTCMCKTGHAAGSGLCPVADGTTCAKATDCVSNSECDKTTKKCKCSSGYEASKGLCTQKSSADIVTYARSMIIVSLLPVALGMIV